jgi:tetratricopeptide (TPR) repeat protein
MKRTHTRSRIARPLALPFALVVLFASCATTEEDPYDFEEADLHGMIYDHANQPVAGAQIVVHDRRPEITDLSGRFVLPDLDRGDVVVIATKEGYEPLTATVSFLDRTQVLYLKLWSLADLIERAASELEAGRLAEAGETVARAKAVAPADPGVRFLEAAHLYQTDGPEPAVAHLIDLLADHPNLAHAHLFLADVYQFELGETELAADSLRRYLALRYDAEIEDRLAALEDEG